MSDLVDMTARARKLLASVKCGQLLTREEQGHLFQLRMVLQELAATGTVRSIASLPERVA